MSTGWPPTPFGADGSLPSEPVSGIAGPPLTRMVARPFSLKVTHMGSGLVPAGVLMQFAVQNPGDNSVTACALCPSATVKPTVANKVAVNDFMAVDFMVIPFPRRPAV